MAFDTSSKLILTLLLLQYVINERIYISAVLKFKFVECDASDKSKGEFEACQVKAVSRNKNRIHMTYKLKRNAINTVVNFQLMKKANGWRPFLYNITLDACDFLRNPKKYVLANIIYTLGANCTNANHSCPYLKGEVIKLNMDVPEENYIIKLFPVDIGEYGLFTKWYEKGKLFASVNGSVLYSGYRNQ